MVSIVKSEETGWNLVLKDNLIISASGSQRVVPRPASPGNSGGMQTRGSHPRPAGSGTRVGPGICAFTSPPGDSGACSSLRTTDLKLDFFGVTFITQSWDQSPKLRVLPAQSRFSVFRINIEWTPRLHRIPFPGGCPGALQHTLLRYGFEQLTTITYVKGDLGSQGWKP